MEVKMIKDTQVNIQNVNFKIDSVVKESAESTLASMGLNMSSYIGMCLRQVAQDRKVPFAPSADPLFWESEYRVYKVKRMVECGLLMRIVVLYQYVCMSITSISLERNLPAIAKPLSAGCKNAAELPFYFKTLELLAEGAGVSDFAETVKKTYAEFIDMFDSLITGELMDGSGFVEEKFPDEEWADLDAEQRLLTVGALFDEFASLYATASESLAARFIGRSGSAQNMEVIRLAAQVHELLVEGSRRLNDRLNETE